MAIRIVRLGSSRGRHEGVRVGTVRRPPRGVPKEQYAARDWYDVWFPMLAPTPETMKLGRQAESAADWSRFRKKYRSEMSTVVAQRCLDLLAALSHTTNFSVGCDSEDETHCHRSILRELLVARGADVVGEESPDA